MFCQTLGAYHGSTILKTWDGIQQQQTSKEQKKTAMVRS
jgi:hypothetical protein